jgi:hypothetical protein
VANGLDSLLSIVGRGESDPNAAITSRTMNVTRVTGAISVLSAAAASGWSPFGNTLNVDQKIVVWGFAFVLLGAVVIADIWARAHTTAASISAEVVIVTEQLNASLKKGKNGTEDVKVAAFRQTGGLLQFLVVRDLAGGEVSAEWRPSSDVTISGT